MTLAVAALAVVLTARPRRLENNQALFVRGARYPGCRYRAFSASGFWTLIGAPFAYATT